MTNTTISTDILDKFELDIFDMSIIMELEDKFGVTIMDKINL